MYLCAFKYYHFLSRSIIHLRRFWITFINRRVSTRPFVMLGDRPCVHRIQVIACWRCFERSLASRAIRCVDCAVSISVA
jgi:hypothetical protein